MMLKKITLLSTLLFLIFGANVFAHSHLESPTSEKVETKVLNTDVSAVTKSDTETETVMKEQATEANDTALDEPSMMNYILPAIMGLIIVFGFGCYWLIYRRKQV